MTIHAPARRLVPLLALLAAILFSSAPSHAVVPFRSEGSLAVPVASEEARPLIPSCKGGTHWSFSGFKRPDNTIYGTFTWSSTMSCNIDMVFMWTDSHMKKLPNSALFSGGPVKCGVDQARLTGTPGCRSVTKVGSGYCNVCNGTWGQDATWKLRFPAPYTHLPYASTNPAVTCTRDLSGKYTCTGRNLAPSNFS